MGDPKNQEVWSFQISLCFMIKKRYNRGVYGKCTKLYLQHQTNTIFVVYRGE